MMRQHLGFGEQTIAPRFRPGGDLYSNDPVVFYTMGRNEVLPMQHNFMHAPDAFQSAVAAYVADYESDKSTDSNRSIEEVEEVNTKYHSLEPHATLKCTLTRLQNILKYRLPQHSR